MTEVAALLMAAGNSRRMGGPNKLWLPYHGEALVAFSARAVMDANLAIRIMVTGRDHDTTAAYGRESGFEIHFNPKFETGFGSSLAIGFNALLARPNIYGAIVMLADMPLITGTHLNQMVRTFADTGGNAIVRAAHNGHPGNPVLLPNGLFAQMAALDGEQSGQAILKASGLPLVLVEIGAAALADIDTPEALAALQEAHL